MATVCRALDDEGVRFVGLCHGVQTTIRLIAGYLGRRVEDIDYICAGINHMGWFIKLEEDGATSTPSCARNSSCPNTMRPKRCAARRSGISATS